MACCIDLCKEMQQLRLLVTSSRSQGQPKILKRFGVRIEIVLPELLVDLSFVPIIQLILSGGVGINKEHVFSHVGVLIQGQGGRADGDKVTQIDKVLLGTPSLRNNA